MPYPVRLANSQSTAELRELMNPDRSVARGGGDVEQFAQQHDLPQVTIAELVAYRRQIEA